MERLVLWHRVLPGAPEGPDAGALAVWTRSVAVRLRAAGGLPLGTLGSAVAAAFDPADLSDAVDLVLELLDESEEEEPSRAPLEVTFGMALGDLEEVFGPDGRSVGWAGSALERAQWLANRARAGEVALGSRAADAARPLYLFGRRVGSDAVGLRGCTIDRGQPRRDLCRQFIRHLRVPAVAPVTRKALEPVDTLAARPEGGRVVLRGPAGAGAAAWLAAAERDLRPPLVLRVGGVPGGLAPLGSLRLTLLRHWESVEGVREGLEGAGLRDRRAVDTLCEIATGSAVSRADAVHAIGALWTSVGGERLPWVVLDPADSVDAATLDVVVEVSSRRVPALIIARLPPEASTPQALLRGDQPLELELPLLPSLDASTVAASLLGIDPSDELAKRVGVLGGETHLGIEEAARTLVASGDLIYDGSRFAWRVGPRTSVQAVPIEALIAERVQALEEVPRRALEVVCVVPDGCPSSLIEAVAFTDGLDETACRQAFERLRAEAFLRADAPWRPSSQVMRSAVLGLMGSDRGVELHARTAQALQATHMGTGAFARATLGYYQAEGGHPSAGAEALLVAGRAALDHGFGRAALRLAAAAVQFDTSSETRAEAQALSRRATGHTSVPPAPPPGPEDEPGGERLSAPEGFELTDLVQQAVEAMLRRDFETVERCIDMATAEGCDRSAAHRMRALAHLARGDHAKAMQILARMHEDGEGDLRRTARSSLTRALILLHAGQSSEAVRAALRALSTSRKLKDPRGEAAAMHTLSWCYRALGLDDDAEAIEDASPA